MKGLRAVRPQSSKEEVEEQCRHRDPLAIFVRSTSHALPKPIGWDESSNRAHANDDTHWSARQLGRWTVDQLGGTKPHRKVFMCPSHACMRLVGKATRGHVYPAMRSAPAMPDAASEVLLLLLEDGRG